MKRTGPSEDHKFVCSDNPGRGIWSGIEGSSKAGRGKGGLISTFACFLATAAGGYVLGGGIGRWPMTPPRFEIFLMFPYFLGS